jgi:outer membrane protein OmpA-like peptidoglycan-associated protein
MRYLLILFCALIPGSVLSQEQFSVFFDSDKFELVAKEQKRLEEWIAKNPDVKVVGIHGFTDEDGTSGYNDTLAKRRINTIFKAISGKIKLREDFKTRSFGELHQQSKIKAENRKVTLYYLLAKDLPRENEILGIKEVAATPVRKIVRNYPEKISLPNPDGTKTEFKLDREFMKSVDNASPGEKLKLENLNFQLNTFAIVPESRVKLFELLMVMQDNPGLKIEIHGHLCCVAKDRFDLSTQRAKAIKNFLVGQGVDAGRVSFKGFGSSEPIYPIPEKTEDERAANRRVEILIVENP